MLDGLDAIDWGALTHAYGSAADLPKLLRDLARPGADHVDVLDELVMLVFEFGRVYDATVAVMPFLLELARDPARTDRARLVSELAEFAYLDGFGWQQAREVAPTDRCAQARATLATARPTVLRLVEDPAPGVRHAAVRLLLADREHDASTARLLRRRFPDELAWLRHELLAVLAELADAPASWFLATARTDPDPTVRAAAMAAALRLSGTEGAAEVRDAAMSLLREVYAEEAPTPHTGQSAPTNPNHRAPEPAPTPATLPPEPAPPPAGPDRRTTEATPAPVGPDGCTAEVASELPEAAPVSVGLDGRGPETAPVVRELGLALGERVADRATLLIDLLRGSSVRARVEAVPVAAAAVRDWRGDHRELIAAIGEQLDHESDTVRHCAAAALAGFGRLAVFAADPLARRLAVEPAATGTDGLGALLVSASEPPRLGPVLAALVNARDPRALPALAVALRQPRPPVYLGSRMRGLRPGRRRTAPAAAAAAERPGTVRIRPRRSHHHGVGPGRRAAVDGAGPARSGAGPACAGSLGPVGIRGAGTGRAAVAREA